MMKRRLAGAFMLLVLTAAGCSAHAGAKVNDDSAGASAGAAVGSHDGSGSGSIRK